MIKQPKPCVNLRLFALGLLTTFMASCSKENPQTGEQAVVNVYNWYASISAEILKEFEEETGIKVQYDLFDNNDMVEAKLLSGNSGYDVIFPSASPYIERQIKAGVYQKIQKDLIPNLKNLDPFIEMQMKVVDPNNEYSVPFFWGTFGFAYVEEIILKRLPNAPVDSYRLLFDPKIVCHFKDDGVSLLDEAVDVFPPMLTYLNKDSHSDSVDDLQQAYENVMAIRPFIKRFSSSRFVNELVGGETCLAQAWSGEAQLAQKLADEVGKKIHIRYVVPKEGGSLWIDAMIIPKAAPHVKNAHLFINFLLKPSISARLANVAQLAVANKTAHPLIDKSIREDQTIYPSPSVMARLKLDLPQTSSYERLRNRLWTQVRIGTPSSPQNGD